MTRVGTISIWRLVARKSPEKTKAKISITADGAYIKLPAHRKRAAMKEETNANRSALDSGILAKAFIPKITRKAKKAIQNSVPRIPVEAICVGINPIPNGKLAPQKGVAFTSTGL